MPEPDHDTLTGWLQIWLRGAAQPLQYSVQTTEAAAQEIVAELAKDINDAEFMERASGTKLHAVRPGLFVRASEVLAVTFTVDLMR